jgi:hypothetical protein
MLAIMADHDIEGQVRVLLRLQNNTPTSLPVLTIGVPPRVLSSRAYAERVATRLLEVLLDVEQYRGTGRLYLPCLRESLALDDTTA